VKVVLLSGTNCIHTARWANGLAQQGVEVHLISAHKNEHELDRNVRLYILSNQAPWGYLTNLFEVKVLLKRIRPDLMNAHYATGYGLLARLIRFKPTLLSVWGSDVYDFPEKSFFHRWLLKGNLQAATAIASTSHCMARRTSEIFQHNEVFITPFGIDEQDFQPRNNSSKKENKIIIGTIKSLKKIYGIDTLIKAFSLVVKNYTGDKDLILEITGGGTDLELLKKLARSLKVENKVIFKGEVPHTKVVDMLNRLDIYVALSRQESFGVAIIEAMACEKPVVVSDAYGLVEVTVAGKTGFVIQKENAKAAADAILKLVADEDLRVEMGKAGREHVLENYTWGKSLDLMIDAYEKTTQIRSRN